MRFALRAVLFIFITGAFFFSMKKAAFAAPQSCANVIPGFSTSGSWPAKPIIGVPYAPLQVSFNNVSVGNYKITCFSESGLDYRDNYIVSNIPVTDQGSGRGSLTFSVTENGCFGSNFTSSSDRNNNWPAGVKIEREGNPSSACTALTYELQKASQGKICSSGDITLSLVGQPNAQGCFQPGEQVSWSVKNVKYSNNTLYAGPLFVGANNSSISTSPQQANASEGIASGSFTISGDAAGKTITFNIYDPDSRRPGNFSQFDKTMCSKAIKVFNTGECTQEDREDQPQATPEQAQFDLCKQVHDTEEAACNECLTKHAGGGIWTALGCIPTDTKGIVASFVTIGLGLSGGVVILTVLAGAFMLATSAGNPKQVEEAQQMISAAVMGLLFVIFSVIILRFLGVTLLNLPGFGS